MRRYDMIRDHLDDGKMMMVSDEMMMRKRRKMMIVSEMITIYLFFLI